MIVFDYERGRYDRSYYEDRGLTERAGDEVRSWFGDAEAERRQCMDYRWDEQCIREGRCHSHSPCLPHSASESLISSIISSGLGETSSVETSSSRDRKKELFILF